MTCTGLTVRRCAFFAFLLPRLEELHVVVLFGLARPSRERTGSCLAALMVDPATEAVTVRLSPRTGWPRWWRPAWVPSPRPSLRQPAGTRPAVRLFSSARWSKRCGSRGSPRSSPAAGNVQEVATDTLEPLGNAAALPFGAGRDSSSTGGGCSGADRVGPRGTAGGARAPRRGAGRRSAGPGGRARGRTTLFRATHSCVARSIGTWRRPSGPKRTASPPDCLQTHTPTRLKSPNTCWPRLRQVTGG